MKQVRICTDSMTIQKAHVTQTRTVQNRTECMRRQAICNVSENEHTLEKYIYIYIYYILRMAPTIYTGNRQITQSLIIFTKIRTLLCNTPESGWGSSVFIWQDMCRAKQKKVSKNISWCSLQEPQASAKMQCLTLTKVTAAKWTDFFCLHLWK